jgi:hypothetical protein
MPLLGSIKVPGGNILISFNLINLFTHFPVDEALKVIERKLNLEHTIPLWDYGYSGASGSV